MTIIDDYLDYQAQYEEKYGINTIVLMQVGHFYEAYAVDNSEENSNGDNLRRLSDALNIQLTRKNKSIIENSRKNPLMIGVNIWSIDKYIQLLLNNNFTVVQIDQTTPPPEPDREVTNIYSPGTNIKHSIKGDSNNLVSVYIEVTKDLKKYKDIMTVGISSIDLSTGENCVYETYSTLDDKKLALDEVFRFIQIHDPKELTLATKNCNMTTKDLIAYLDLSHRVLHVYNDDQIDKKYFNMNYHRQFLEKIFPNYGMLSVIEYLDLEFKNLGLISYIMLLVFAYEHNDKIIFKISSPDVWDDTKHLILANNTINQLNVVSHGKLSINSKFDSLFGVINNASTSIGRRLLRDRILKPVLDEDILEKRYNLVEKMMEYVDDNPVYKLFETSLSKIIDIERLHRRMALQYIQPADFSSLDFSYENIITLIKLSGDYQLCNSILPKQEDLDNFYNFIDEYRKEFNLDEIIKFHLDKINKSFFNLGMEPEIDRIQENIDLSRDLLKKLGDKLSNYIESGSNYVKLESNDRDGYYLTATKKRCDVLQKRFINMNYSDIVITCSNKTITINPKDIDIRNITKTNNRIEHNLIKSTSYKLRSLEESLGAISKEIFLKKMEEYHQKYGDSLKSIAKFVGAIDLIKSSSKTAIMYGYCRPEIDLTKEDSYMDVLDLRHPIIERIQTDVEYIPNDILLGGKDTKGVLLFGTNASGKSSLMKSIGLNIILAQAGMFVAAKRFRFKPYQYIFSRINNNDNIFKGESSFAVEMSELRCILKRANNNSLILGDELCSGTESVSAQSIFASSMIHLSKRNTSFIFATHLHELCNISEIMELNNISIKHLKVIYDKDSGVLVYDRKLEDGSGPAIYGLEVCKAMDMDDEFLGIANKIRRKLMKIDDEILVDKKSNYNSELFVDKCMICHNLAEDVHHIKFQCTADINKMIGHIQKDIKCNLVSLCKKCHNNVHNGGLVINGYRQTSNGIILDYSELDNEDILVKKKNRKKYSDVHLDIIKELQNIPKITQTHACNKLKTKHNIDISKSTLSKIWKGIY